MSEVIGNLSPDICQKLNEYNRTYNCLRIRVPAIPEITHPAINRTIMERVVNLYTRAHIQLQRAARFAEPTGLWSQVVNQRNEDLMQAFTYARFTQATLQKEPRSWPYLDKYTQGLSREEIDLILQTPPDQWMERQLGLVNTTHRKVNAIVETFSCPPSNKLALERARELVADTGRRLGILLDVYRSPEDKEVVVSSLYGLSEEVIIDTDSPNESLKLLNSLS